MNIALYSPYFKTMGGGERYMLSIALYLSKHHTVTIFADESIRVAAQKYFGMDLTGVTISSPDLITSRSQFKKIRLLASFDVLFAMTDGSIFFSTAKQNFLIIQSPVHIPQHSWKNALKLKNWKFLCYSGFMQHIIEAKTQEVAIQLPPAIDTFRFGSVDIPKDNIILSVGRFFPAPHNKKHDILIETFKRYFLQYFKGYKLIIAGGLSESGGREVLKELQSIIETAPVEILIDVPFDQLIHLMARAKFYWHAAGFGEDLEKHPERAEHFGITPLEAMAAGTVPLAYNGGGPADVIKDSINGFLWDVPEELAEKTSNLIRHPKQLRQFQLSAKNRAEDFSEEKFIHRLDELLRNI